MEVVVLRSIIGLLVVVCAWASPASALDPGNYAVECSPSVTGGRETRIRMDMVDLQTLRQSLGTIISGVSLADGRKVILIANDRSCSLVEVGARSARP
jgi:hypothetical protein